MKQLSIPSLILALALAAGTGTGCKTKQQEAAPNQTINTENNEARETPVVISPDESLQQGARDAVKDYPGVDATVDNGVITLSGTISRDRLTPLMQSLQALNPKRVNNQLKVTQ